MLGEYRRLARKAAVCLWNGGGGMQVHSAAIRERIKPLTQQQTSQAVSKFLQDVASIFGSSGRLLVAGHCSTAADLAGLEASLQSSISQWKHEGTGQSFPDALLLPKTLQGFHESGRPMQNAPLRAPQSVLVVLEAERLSAAESGADSLRSPRRSLQPSTPKRGVLSPRGFEEELPSGWEATCEWVLTKRAALWDMVLEPSFVQACSCYRASERPGASTVPASVCA